MNIREIIQAVSKNNLPISNYICQVIDVDETTRTCTVAPVNGDADFTDVSLQASCELTEGVFVKPLKNSAVIVSLLDKNNAYVSLYSQIENIEIVVNETSLKIEDGSITMNGGELGGLIKIGELKTQLDKLTKRVDDIITALNNGTPGTGSPDSGAALIGSIKASLALIIDKEDFSNIENEKITHG